MDKNKQIEEMANDLGETWVVDLEGNPHDLSEVLMQCDIETISEQLYEMNYRKASEVVRKIFEEIDKMLYKLLNDPHYIVGDMCWDVKELKKKFTGNVYPDCSICSLCERDVIICQEEGRCMKNA